MKPFNPHEETLRLRGAVQQGVILVVLGALIAIGFNAFRSSGLPWFAPGPPVSTASPYYNDDLQEIPLAEAWSLYQQGTGLFLDARDPVSFLEGHIKGALNVPPGETQTYLKDIITLAKSGLVLIVYCDGVNCPLSPELARTLQRFGVPSVKVLVDGWRRWLEAGYPVESGGS